MNKRTVGLAALCVLLCLAVAGWPSVVPATVGAQEDEAEPPRTAPTSAPAVVMGAGQPQEFKAGEILVKFRAGVSTQSVEGAPARYDASVSRVLYSGDVQVWQVAPGEELAVIESLAADPLVEFAEPNYVYHALGTPNDPSFWKQWAHTRMHSTAAWEISTGSAAVTIAIIDTGIDENHPDLLGKIVAGWDFVDGDSNPHDMNGHGTHVAGIATAVSNNGTGIAGVDWQARIMPLRALDAQGSGYNSDITDAITWAYQHGAKILNLSLGGPGYSSSMQSAVTSAYNAGSLVVAAMGNDGSSVPMYPAAYSNTLAVAATNPNDSRSGYSNFGAHCDVAAPGGEMNSLHDPDGIYSSLPMYSVYLNQQYGYSTQYDYLQGTSQAAPHVAGLAALIWSLQPSLTPLAVQTLIEDTAVDLGSAGWDQYYGHGRIDALAALQVAGPPPAPVLSPISNADGDGSYLVDWSDVTGVTNYTLQEDDNAAFSSPTTRYSGLNSQANVSGLGGGTWYYRVRASNDNGTGPWSNVRSTTVKPAAPVLEPIDNPGQEDEYLLSWSAPAGASGYTLQEDDNAAFSSPITRYDGELHSYPVTGQASGTWYYRVSAYNAGGTSPWSNDEATTVVVPSPLPLPILSPISNPDGDQYVVKWSQVGGAASYRLEESVTPYFESPQIVYEGALLQFSVMDQPGGTWSYRVRALGGASKSPWSSSQSVAVPTQIYLPFLSRARANYGLPISEGFEGGVVPPPGWTRVQTNPRQTWKTQVLGGPFQGSFAADCEYDEQLGNQNEVLLSPEFLASEAQAQFYSFGSVYWCRDDRDNCDLNIWLVVGGWGGGDDIQVYTADEDWPTSWAWTRSTVNLTPYLPAGTPVRLGFQYVGKDGAQIGLDSIQITKP